MTEAVTDRVIEIITEGVADVASGRVVVGFNWTAVEGPAAIGFAATPSRGDGATTTPETGRYGGRPLSALAALAGSANPYERAIGIAATHAHSNVAAPDLAALVQKQVADVLAQFNIQTATQTDKRYFIGLPSPAAAGVPAATIFFHPWPLVGKFQAMAAIAVIVIPAILMVSTIKFRSFKTINLGWDRAPTFKLMGFAALIVFIATEPRWALVIIAYTYLVSGFVGLAITYLRPRRPLPPEA